MATGMQLSIRNAEQDHHKAAAHHDEADKSTKAQQPANQAHQKTRGPKTL